MKKHKPIDYTGDNLRTIRKSAGLTQEQLDQLTGIAQGRISKIEAGANFTRKTLLRILEAINKHNGGRK